jgi:UDP-N-acetylmuramoyl-tripeptide--D-alanyl-D-alanine ligase
MQSALDNLIGMNADKKVVILGAMKELGEDTALEHERIGEILQQADFDQVFLLGKEMEAALSRVDGRHFVDKSELFNALKTSGIEKAVILLKGSRSMGLEELLEAI